MSLSYNGKQFFLQNSLHSNNHLLSSSTVVKPPSKNKVVLGLIPIWDGPGPSLAGDANFPQYLCVSSMCSYSPKCLLMSIIDIELSFRYLVTRMLNVMVVPSLDKEELYQESGMDHGALRQTLEEAVKN